MKNLIKICFCGIIISICNIHINAEGLLDAITKCLSSDKNDKDKNNEKDNKNVNEQKNSEVFDWSSVYKKISPSLVSVFTLREDISDDFSFENIFDNFFNNGQLEFSFSLGSDGFKFNNNHNKNSKKSIRAGTGICIKEQDKKLYIATNYHVVSGSEKVAVLFNNDEKDSIITAKVHSADSENDLAVLEIDIKDIDKNSNINKNKIKCIEKWGNSNDISVTDNVLSIGNPFGVGLSFCNDMISAKNNNSINKNNSIENYIQHKSDMSNGVLVNKDGNIIGINTNVYSNRCNDIRFAIPSNKAKNIINSLIKYKKIFKGWIGISTQLLMYEEAKNLGILPDDIDKLQEKPKAFGAIVSQVFPNSPADKAGIKSNDIIISFNEKLIDENNSIQSLIDSCDPEEKVNLIILRRNKDNNKIDKKNIELKICDCEQYKDNTTEKIDELGITIMDTLVKDNNQVVITEVNNSNKYNKFMNFENIKSFKKGDIITRVNGNEVKNTKKLKEFVHDYFSDNTNKTITLSITRYDLFNNESTVIVTTTKL